MSRTLVRAHMWRHIAHRERRRTWSNDELLAKPIASAPPMPKRTAGANSAAVPPRSCLDPQPTMTAMRAMASTWLARKDPRRTSDVLERGPSSSSEVKKKYPLPCHTLSHATGWGGRDAWGGGYEGNRAPVSRQHNLSVEETLRADRWGDCRSAGSVSSHEPSLVPAHLLFQPCSWSFINAGTTSHTGTGQERLKGMIGKTLDAPMHCDARLTNCFSTLAAAQLYLPTLFPSAEAAPRRAGR